MAPRILRFPFPLHIGTDICQVSRIQTILASPRGPRFIRRVLAEEELARPRQHISAILDGAFPAAGAEVQNSPRVPSLREAAVFMAGRFAAKEAAIKAHPHRRLTFHDVILQRQRDEAQGGELGSGPPVVLVRGEKGRSWDQMAMVSISHDGDYATAVCMGFDPAAVGGAGDG